MTSPASNPTTTVDLSGLDVVVVLPPAARSVYLPSGSGGGQVSNRAGRLMGVNYVNLSDTLTAAINAYDGTGTDGQHLLSLYCGSQTSANEWLGFGGVRFDIGLWVQLTANGPSAVVWFVDEA